MQRDPADLLIYMTIITDASGNPVGAVWRKEWGPDDAIIGPISVGPFDTLEEVLARLKGALDFQLTLW